MPVTLFPNLKRIYLDEHAKSNNYEKYAGIILDKKDNTFKVVVGFFRDKKEMYEKMKERGYILRKAYEEKVWQWINENADNVMIAYLMLSTAFSKWRSNNVLHTYYEKLLHDLPELNREREKGNPNTRGGDFITTDDKPAPKRKTESMELEEDKKGYYTLDNCEVQFVGVKKDGTKEAFLLADKRPVRFSNQNRLIDPWIIDKIDDYFNRDNVVRIADDDYETIEVYINDLWTPEKEEKKKEAEEEGKVSNFKPKMIYNRANSRSDQAQLTQEILGSADINNSVAIQNEIEKQETLLKTLEDLQKNIDETEKWTKEDEEKLKKLSGEKEAIKHREELKQLWTKLGIDIKTKIEELTKEDEKKLKELLKKKEVVFEIGDGKEWTKEDEKELNELLKKKKEKVDKWAKVWTEENEKELKELLVKRETVVNNEKLKRKIEEVKLKKKILSSQKNIARHEEKQDPTQLKKRVQAKAINFLKTIYPQTLAGDDVKVIGNYLSNFLSKMTEDRKEELDRLIKSDLESKKLNTSFGLTNEDFEPISVEELHDFASNVKNGLKGEPLIQTDSEDLKKLSDYVSKAEKIAEEKGNPLIVTKGDDQGKPLVNQVDKYYHAVYKVLANNGEQQAADDYATLATSVEEKKKKYLHNLIWYVIADSVDEKTRNTSSGLTDETNKTSDVIQGRQTADIGGLNSKTQNGDPAKTEKTVDFLRNSEDFLHRRGIQTEPPKDVQELSQAQIDKTKEKVANSDTLRKDVYIAKASYDENQDEFYNQFTELNNLVNDYANKNEKNQALVDKAKRKALWDKALTMKNAATILSIPFGDDNPWRIEQAAKEFLKNDESKKELIDTVDKNVKTLEELEVKNNKQADEKQQNESIEPSVAVNYGASALDGSIPYQGKGFGYSAGPIKMTGQIVEDTTKTELNSNLFDGETLIPEVRDALYRIAMVFKDYLDLPFEIKDVYFTGSNANYNYHDKSDIDLHLVYDFEQAGANAELLSKYLVAAKKDFNDKYDISVKGLPVELGCENLSQPLVSTGVYSLGANTWVIKPTNSGIEIPDVDMNAFNDLSMEIDDTIRQQNTSAIENLWKRIRELRKTSLEKDGEFGMGNMLFKKLRNADYLEKLRNNMYATQSRDLSLESSEKMVEGGEFSDKHEKIDYSEYMRDVNNEIDSADTQDLLTNKALLNFLDGYKDRNAKREVKEEIDGVLNEGDIPLYKINKAISDIENGFPPNFDKYCFIDPINGTLCYFKYNKKEDVIYLIPVRRERVDGKGFIWKKHPEERQEVSPEEFVEIVYDEINQTTLHKTPLYDDKEETLAMLKGYKNNIEIAFNNWCKEHEDTLHFDKLSPNNKTQKNSLIRQMYRDSTILDIKDIDLRNNYAKYYEAMEEDVKKRLNVDDDTNDANKVMTALGIHPDYMTRPIYEVRTEVDKKTGRLRKREIQWGITDVDNVLKNIDDEGNFDFNKIPEQRVNFYLLNLLNSDERQTVDLKQLKEIITRDKRNDINYNGQDMQRDIYQASQNPTTKLRQQTDRNHELWALTSDQVRAALNYVQSNEFRNKLGKRQEQLEKQLAKINKKEQLKEYMAIEREIKYLKTLLTLTSKGNLVKRYDSLRGTSGVDYEVIKMVLNAVEPGVHVTPKYSVQDQRGVLFYLTMPAKGKTVANTKQPYHYSDPVNAVKKLM